MSDKLPISLVIFSTTVQKQGRNDYYKICINNLASLIDLNLFPQKFLSVKYPPEQRKEAEEYKKWAEDKGFECILRAGIWENGKMSKCQEYLKDIISTYHLDALHMLPYVFQCEDDTQISVKSGKLEDYLIKSIGLLSEHKDLLACHFSDRLDEYERINRLNAKYGWTHKKALRVEGTNEFFVNNDILSFRNYIARTRDLFQMTRFIAHNFNKIHPMPETECTNALLALSDGQTPLVCWNPENILHYHMRTDKV